MMYFAGCKAGQKTVQKSLRRSALLAGTSVFLLAGLIFSTYPKWQVRKEQVRQDELLGQVRQAAEKSRGNVRDSESGEGMPASGFPASDSADDEAAGDSGIVCRWQAEQPNAKEGEGIGILTIPKIDAELPVTAGASQEQMKLSEGWVMQTDPIGSIGNAVVAGHRSYEHGRHFNRLGELAQGDEIFYTAADGTEMEFAVEEVLTVGPDDPAVFKLPGEGIAQLTLYTCTPVREATHRLVVRTQRIK